MSKEERNKKAIGDFGQSPTYKDVLETITHIAKAKRTVAIELRQARADRRRIVAELECIYDDVRSIHPGLSRDEFDYVYTHTLLNQLERMLSKEPPDGRDGFMRGDW